MHNGRALFPGASESAQIDLVFQKLGTPTEADYPGLVELPKWKVSGQGYDDLTFP